MASETLGSERPHELIDILKGRLWLLWDSMMEINKDASEQPGREVTGCGQGRKEMVRDIIGRRTSRLADVLGLGRRWKEGSRVIALAISGLVGAPRETTQAIYSVHTELSVSGGSVKENQGF